MEPPGSHLLLSKHKQRRQEQHVSLSRARRAEWRPKGTARGKRGEEAQCVCVLLCVCIVCVCV